MRERIAEGHYLPGSRLSEEAIGSELKISRNTLREAFRLLTHERLLLHEPYRGVSVRVLSVHDVTDLYRVRKVIECGVVATSDLRAVTAKAAKAAGASRAAGGSEAGDTIGAGRVERIAAAVAEGEAAGRSADWQALGTANIRFHQALVALGDSPRLSDLMRGILAELRLVFHVMADPRRFHEPYLARNREILELLRDGDQVRAAAALRAYLDDAERQLVAAYAAK